MVTNDIFTSSLNYGRKAYLKAAGGSGEQHDLEVVQLDLDRTYRMQALTTFLGPDGENGATVCPKKT